MMNDVLTVGETMLRFSPPGVERLIQARNIESWVAGSESNVAATLCALGCTATWAGRLPDNPLGQRIAAELRALGVDTSAVVWTSEPGDRVGTFYFEAAAPPRPAQTIYDRAGSSASRLTPADLPDALFATHRHLHVSGITPALSPSCAETVVDAIARANAQRMSVSLDVNYRAKLWTPEQAAAALHMLLPRVTLLICAVGDAAALFGISADSAADCARELQQRFGVPECVVTAGAKGAASCDRSGVSESVEAFPVEASIGRLGSGDAFAAGYLAAYLADGSLTERLRLGAAAAALKRTIPGDMLIATREEVEAVLVEERESGWR